MLFKKCTKCKIEKSGSEFGKRSLSRDGLTYRCKICTAEDMAPKRAALREYGRQWYVENKELHAATGKRWIAANYPGQLAKWKAYREDNREKVNAGIAAWAKRNPERIRLNQQIWVEENRDKTNEKSRRWDARHPHKRRALTANYFASQLRAMPPWANRRAMAEFYRLSSEIAAETGIRHHVDHIVPLRSKYVCGLHCEANLQVVPFSVNCRKSNKFVPGQDIAVIGDIPCLM